VTIRTARDKFNRSTHHRKPRSLGGDDNPRNLSIVQRKMHEAWHLMFQNYEPQRIANIINESWIDPDFELVVRRR
jgi:hypothetical protein